MKLESQCVSLELAKRLKELDVKQNSYFKWISNDEGETYVCWINEKLYENEYAAFTVSELGKMLPQSIIYDDCELILGMTKSIDEWITIYYEEEAYTPLDFRDESLANSMAKMLIHLLENKLVEVQK